jgi:hypothetical protein
MLRVPSLLVLALAATVSARESRPPRGRVRHATARRAYLDAGKSDGLKLGDKLQLVRNARPMGECKIDQLADHGASCLADARVGDTVTLPAPPPEPPPAPPPPQVTPVDPSVQTRLDASGFVKVDFKRSPGRLSGALPLIDVSIGHTAFITFNGGQFEQERLDFALEGLSLRFGGFRAFAQLTALVYSQRPSNVRFRPGDVFQIYVWDLEASSREVGRSWTLSVGRVWPHHAPGLTVMDGLQVGWRSKSGDAEVGVLGGTLPDASTLYPSPRWIGGLYYGVTHAGGRNSVLRLFRHEARLSARDTALGPQLELEGLMQAWITRWVDVGAQTRATIGAGDWALPRFEAARASLGVHPKIPLRLYANFRYLDSRVADPDALTASLFSTGRWFYSDADCSWDATRWLTLSLHGGEAQRTDTSLGRQYVGVDVVFPNAFRGNGGISLGYQEEFGWIAGRTANLQLTGNLPDRMRLQLRAAYFEDVPTANSHIHELGLYLSVDARLWRWLSLRISVLNRLGLDGGKTPVGLVGRAELAGAF